MPYKKGGKKEFTSSACETLGSCATLTGVELACSDGFTRDIAFWTKSGIFKGFGMRASFAASVGAGIGTTGTTGFVERARGASSTS